MSDIDTNQTVATFAAGLPGAAGVFRRHGVSFCCGGQHSLAEAAAEAGISVETLMDDLQALVDSAGQDAPQDTGLLISHILGRYHETHRAELNSLIPLAEKVERVHGEHPEAPLGLADVLVRLQRDLEERMREEEQVLFPMMQSGDSEMVRVLLTGMCERHQAEARSIGEIEHVTHGLSVPDGACNSWRALYAGMRKLSDDLVTHGHLEKTKLFPRFKQ
ncbi:MAG: DUF542 domain-containing protein [Alphaproteobacteria bacterium]|jgi:regulator of cell morphogenesis and NO signaling|nr:DUF542 domain-containing protein [Alphaproteobacteria bacterium]MBU1548611.1 DUF542 domain-containing protein [Alphaproteobacteria bacterium]MBU2334427.1 DUF542 domain-containing protein [Alphaproteobacteria bacterium]MBU2388491.1 DUF542 domain-containing protein [Alphaproteobacteria bacterium]